MEIISLNTSLFFSMKKMNGAIKSFWNHYVIGKQIIHVQSRSNLILSENLNFPACDFVWLLCHKKCIYPVSSK